MLVIRGKRRASGNHLDRNICAAGDLTAPAVAFGSATASFGRKGGAQIPRTNLTQQNGG